MSRNSRKATASSRTTMFINMEQIQREGPTCSPKKLEPITRVTVASKDMTSLLPVALLMVARRNEEKKIRLMLNIF